MARRPRPPSPDPQRRRAEEARDLVAGRILLGGNRHGAVAAVGLGKIAPVPVVVVGIYDDHRDDLEEVLALADYQPIEVHYIKGRIVSTRT